jgi:hypothetical protein
MRKRKHNLILNLILRFSGSFSRSFQLYFRKNVISFLFLFISEHLLLPNKYEELIPLVGGGGGRGRKSVEKMFPPLLNTYSWSGVEHRV